MKNKQKGFVNILLIVLIVLVGLGGAYLYMRDDNLIVDDGMFRNQIITEESEKQNEENNIESVGETTPSNPYPVTNTDNTNIPSNIYSTYTDVTGLYTLQYPSNWKVLNKNTSIEYGDLTTVITPQENFTALDIRLISKKLFDNLWREELQAGSSVKFGENIFKEFTENISGDG